MTSCSTCNITASQHPATRPLGSTVQAHCCPFRRDTRGSRQLRPSPNERSSPETPESLTFAYEEADLGVDQLLHPVALPGYEPQDGQEGLDVAEAPLLVLQLLLLSGLVDAGEDVGLGVAEHVEEGLALRMAPKHLEDSSSTVGKPSTDPRSQVQTTQPYVAWEA